MGGSNSTPKETELKDQSLCVLVEQAILYLNNDMTKINPYVRLRVGNKICQTNPARNCGTSPRWNEMIECEYEPTVSDIYLDILDQCTFKPDEPLAWTKIVIPEQVKTGGTCKDWYRLDGARGEGTAGTINLIMDLKLGKSTNINESTSSTSNLENQNPLASTTNDSTILAETLEREPTQVATQVKNCSSDQPADECHFLEDENVLAYSPFTRVNCQFCLQIFADLKCLYHHVRYNCKVIKNQTFKLFDRASYSHLQILSCKTNQLKCSACNFSTFNFKELIEHSNTEEHEIKVKDGDRKLPKSETNFLYCTPCNTNVSDNLIQFEQHLVTVTHDCNCNKTCNHLLWNKEDATKMNFSFSMDKCNILRCFLCNVDVPCQDLNLHVKIRNHKTPFNVHCTPCSQTFSNISVFKHKESDSHRTNVNVIYCTFCNILMRSYEDLAHHQVNECLFDSLDSEA